MKTLSDYLESTGLRQSDFGEMVGIGQAMVSRLKNGTALPSLSLALAIERATSGAVPVRSWGHPPAHGPATQADQGAGG